jgi:DNA-binding NtrC family response regulator
MTAARIMIAEDERITAEDLRDILTDLGYSVTAVVSTGADAVRQAEETAPDLVIMDIRLEGDMDGIEAAQLIRTRAKIPIVYLTAHADQRMVERAKQAAPLGYIVKPFQEDELRASIEIALHKSAIDEYMHDTQTFLSARLSAIGTGVICTDQNGIVTSMNAIAEAWTGWKQRDAQNRRGEEVWTVIDQKTRNPLDGPLKDALHFGTLNELPEGALLVGRQGVARRAAGSISPIRNHKGEISGAVVIFGEPESADTSAPAAHGRDAATRELGGFPFIAESPSMRHVVNFVRRVAPTAASTILLDGESGTGKDVLATFLHHHSHRRSAPFLAINCAAIPETLLESELFGYEKGAFTDARALKKGILEMARGGTVFLDEIGEMPLALQAKLLRVLEEQTFRRLGGLKDIRIDARVITATNRDLREAIQNGRFRLDLYYRLNVIQVTVPPLRARRDDILPLAEHFIRLFNKKFKRDINGLSPEAANTLLAHDWPGNVRELRNVIEHAMVLEETRWLHQANLGIKSSGGVPAKESNQPLASVEGQSLERVERAVVLAALQKANWNQTRAANALCLTRDTLRYKMKKFNLKASSAAGV